MADPSVAAVQALIRWDAATHADRELAERAELRFPPSVRVAALTGPADAVADLLSVVTLPADADVLGPVPVPVPVPSRATVPSRAAGAESGQVTVRFLVRAPVSAGTRLAVALRSGLAERSAHKEQGTVRLQLDPAELI
jgi:primosomal protein N' (replication factor Y) (superfamily II helicase)